MTRRSAAGPLAVVLVAAIVGAGALAFLFGLLPAPEGGAPAASAPAATRPAAAPRPPEVTIAHPTCCAQAARYLSAAWSSSAAVESVAVALVPDPGSVCTATLDGATRTKGTFGCAGLLRGATDFTATLTVRSAAGTFPVTHRFRTMGDRLTAVPWHTEFEDPKAEPLACAAASVRIVQHYTTGHDKATAEQILRQGQAHNRSKDPGLDPVAIATVQRQLDARNAYHYYRLDTREDATYAAVYWLLRSGKPVHVISLAGQHDPLLIGFSGAFGTHFGDPSNRVTGVVVQDPQRGDVRPETASRRPDKYRSAEFQTGRLLGLDEWYRDEWWLAFGYAGVVDGVDIDRTDGAYPRPHWAGRFVIVVDDGDAEWPSDREGRVRFR